jgi:hypothetical protein
MIHADHQKSRQMDPRGLLLEEEEILQLEHLDLNLTVKKELRLMKGEL